MQRFPYGKTSVLGFGFFGISIIWPLFNSLIPPMLDDLGLSAVAVGFVLTWDNIINMFSSHGSATGRIAPDPGSAAASPG